MIKKIISKRREGRLQDRCWKETGNDQVYIIVGEWKVSPVDNQENKVVNCQSGIQNK